MAKTLIPVDPRDLRDGEIYVVLFPIGSSHMTNTNVNSWDGPYWDVYIKDHPDDRFFRLVEESEVKPKPESEEARLVARHYGHDFDTISRYLTNILSNNHIDPVEWRTDIRYVIDTIKRMRAAS